MRAFIGLCVALAAAAAWADESASTALAITHVTVIDATGAPPQADMTVIVNDQRITELGKSGEVHAPVHAVIVNGRGRYLIPGLWDMHVHTVFGDWLPRDERVVLPLFVANGVTGVRDMGGELDVLKEWRAQIASGKLLGPRMVIAGPMLDGPVPHFPSSAPVANAADGRKVVDDLKARGVDFIKIQSYIPRDGYFAAADEAKKQGITFVGHVPDAVRASEASNAGQKSFEHLIGIFEGSSPLEDEFIKGTKTEKQFLSTYDTKRAETLFALLAKNQTWQCPTLVWERGGNLIDQTDFAADTRAKYVPAYWKDVTWKRFMEQVEHDFNTDDLATRKRFVEKELEVVNAMHRAGVPFLAGTDTPSGVYIFPGFSLHEELQRFVAAGFTPLEALQTATINPARFFHMEDQWGTIENGK